MDRPFQCNTNSVVSTDNRDQVMNALRTVSWNNDVINVHELGQIVRGLYNKKAAGIDGISSEVPPEGAQRHVHLVNVHMGGGHCTLTRPFLILNSFPNHPSPYDISVYLSPLVQWPIVSPVESYCRV